VTLDAVLRGEGLRRLPAARRAGLGRVVGYEALVRGPAGTPLERPDQLFARATPPDGSPSWTGPAAPLAVRGALDARLARPAPVRQRRARRPRRALPRAPADALSRAEELDLVLEVTERALTDRPADLIAAVEGARERGWSVALDDVGADSRSLALLSLLRPDVVKLDLRLIQARPDREIAEVVSAVNAYAERTGAIVLAEGVETDAHVVAATAVGATHAQGWLYGRPGPLPHAGAGAAAGASALRFVPRAPRAPGTTPFEVVGQVLPVRRGTKPLLLEMSWHLERQALELGETAILVAAFQTADRFTPKTRVRYAELAERIAFVCGLASAWRPSRPPASAAPRWPTTTRCATSGPWWWSRRTSRAPSWRSTWATRGPDEERRFDFALTYDRDLVMTAANSLMQRVQPVA
jgi:EAL domain-containing protein (putative c-di-GMP-specific phosphodiesterase class I)